MQGFQKQHFYPVAWQVPPSASVDEYSQVVGAWSQIAFHVDPLHLKKHLLQLFAGDFSSGALNEDLENQLCLNKPLNKQSKREGEKKKRCPAIVKTFELI